MSHDATEMHPTRWGDPARAAALPETARGLVELVFPVTDHRVDETRAGVAAGVGGRRGACCATWPPWSAPSTCTPTTRPGGCAPAASPRPTCSAPAPATSATHPTPWSGRPTPSEVQAVLEVAARAPGRGGALRRRYVGHRRPRRAPRGLRRRAQPRPGADEAAARRRPGLDDGHPRAGTARSRGRGAAGRAPADPGPLPAVVRVRHDRRLRGDPLQRPVVGRLRALRLPGDRSRRSPRRPARWSSATRRRAPPAPTCASSSSARRARSA